MRHVLFGPTDHPLKYRCVSRLRLWKESAHTFTRRCVLHNTPFPFQINPPLAGATSQLTRHRPGSRPRSSLLITNERAPASRFLRDPPAPPRLLSSSLPLSLPLPVFAPPPPCLGSLFLWQKAQDSPFAEWAAGSGGGKRRNRKKAQKEEGGSELSNRIKGEQRNGEHLKYL